MTSPRSPQLGRIARLIVVDPDELTGLDGVPDDDLRRLHDQIGETYFAEGRPVFARVAGLSKVLPAVVAGKLAERFLPPHFAARTAELLDPPRARDLVSKVSVPYLAELSLSLDPTRSRPVVRALPPGRVGEVATELFRRREYAAMAELVGTVSPEALAVVLDAASGRDLLDRRPAARVDRRDRHRRRDIADAKIDDVLRAVADDERWDDGSYLLQRLAERAPDRVVARLAALGKPRRERFAQAAAEGRLSRAAADVLERASAPRAQTP